MKHIIFSDVDGTVYGKDHKIHPQTIKDIKFAQSLGVEFVICTGNAYFENMTVLAEELDVRYVITSNGGSIYDRELGDFIYKSMIPAAKANEILQEANKSETASIFWDEKNLFVNKYVSEELKELIKNAMRRDSGVTVTDKVETDAFKIEFYDDEHKIDEMFEFNKGFDLQQARMKPIHVEVTHNGVSKGNGIKVLCEKLGVDISKTMGIGDSANDLPMFEVVGYSYAMDNAKPGVKGKAEYYTSDVKQNGLGEAIIDFLHREKLDRGL